MRQFEYPDHHYQVTDKPVIDRLIEELEQERGLS